MPVVLTVDLGNTRAKARLWNLGSRAPEKRAGADFSGGTQERELAAWLAHGPPVLALFSSVASAERTARVREVLASHASELIEGPDCGLEIRCRAPERVGQDRLYAARGALAELGRSCLVVDAGTALTVDLVLHDPPAFLGGAIAAGPELCARALRERTAHLPRIEPRPGVPALGRDTEEALRSGLAWGFRGAAERLVEELAREAGVPDLPVVLTGGARAFLLEPGPFTARSLRVAPDLVHRGLIEAVRGALDGGRR